jgi:hypothetical protein
MSEGFLKKTSEGSRIRVKTPEEIQAQIAAYAAEKIHGNHDRAHVFDNIVDLAAGDAVDSTRITGDRDYDLDNETGKLEAVPAGVDSTIEAKDYAEFLRSVRGSKYEAIKGRAEILSAYKDFAPAIKELKETINIKDAIVGIVS